MMRSRGRIRAAGAAFAWVACVAVLAGSAMVLPAGRAAHAQVGSAIPEARELVKITASPVAIVAGGRATAQVHLAILPGWHINANPPNPDYMIPTEIALAGAAGVRAGAPHYPLAHGVKLSFEDSELQVYDGSATLGIPLTASAQASNGTHTLQGTLTFQACDDKVCLPPQDLPFTVAVTVSGGSNAPPPPAHAPGDPSATPPPAPPDDGERSVPDTLDRGTGFMTSPDAAPPGAARRRPAALDNPIARQLEAGGWAAFLTLFLIGLALNLTPCVYPMIGVTVSIFGARRAAPTSQVLGLAILYVLGMAVMYSTLGVVAALTGGLFGGFMQSPIVLAGIGVLLLVLALGMFGLYEFQIPPQLLARLGGQGATSAAGVFASGLLVGVFAAPCIGPPIVALLTVVGAKGDPLYGFTSFFTLAMGLGAPYLVLGTFSNLIQRLPRSGDWMVWVKKVFGTVLVGVGLFYLVLAIRPDLVKWVAPAALLLGGLYLGFFEKSAAQRLGFQVLKGVTGAAAMFGAVAMVAFAPKQAIAFQPFDEARLASTLASGQSAMLDFSADWCVPCHELEQVTFTHPDVIAAARSFATFKVDLTSYRSPESERLRRQYAISGVPTVLFLTPAGVEVREARVEGFLPPSQFLERLARATGGGPSASR
jgi:thiol:disulfide interchange protein DsbD